MNNPENNFESAPNPEENSPQHIQEIIDSLRLETQTVSPEQREKFSALVRECHSAFLSLYGKYIEHPLTDQEMANRFILTDQETYKTFYDEYGKYFVTLQYSKDKGIMARFNYGDINFVIGHNFDAWEIASENLKEKMIKMESSENKAKEKINRMVQTNAFTHEIAHMYGDPSLMVWFQECGARYYGWNIEFKKEHLFLGTDHKAAINYYSELILRYGEKIHQIYFSRNFNPKDQEFLSELDQEFEKGPGYKGIFGE